MLKRWDSLYWQTSVPERKERERWIKARERHVSDQCNRLCFLTACSFGAGCILGSFVQTTHKYGWLKSMTCFIQKVQGEVVKIPWARHDFAPALLLLCHFSETRTGYCSAILLIMNSYLGAHNTMLRHVTRCTKDWVLPLPNPRRVAAFLAWKIRFWNEYMAWMRSRI